ncbi:hypothetical protein [Shewanella gaetbuli]|uniref:Uncharacterized protein n=1 Tax=Shewanella gaetbuli TaxID=220752 RepID=A0A9X2CLN9_9GAMM|nr:hypothetical protein [Shewanella gaetbuli]MCL1142924.1 hypothetical protein [Shewanella gaetbuli]
MWWRFIIITLAYLLIGAHFLRFNHIELAAISALLPVMLLFKKPIINRFLQAGLLIGSIVVWGVSTIELITMRISMDAPWIRLACIMGAVIAFTLFAAYLCSQLKNQYRGLRLYH